MRCYGDTYYGQLGNFASGFSLTIPDAVAGGGTWKSISAAGSFQGCGIKSNNTAWCWAKQTSGELGNGTGASTEPQPVAVSGGSLWKSIRTGSVFTCGIKNDDSAWCWGAGGSGQLGDGTTTAAQTTPVSVSGGYSWKLVDPGANHACGIQSDDSAWCWGMGSSGQLGDGTTTAAQTTPVTVSGGASWKTISAGVAFSCGIKSDNSAWCWGDRSNGKLGDGGATSGSQTTPVAVSGGASWKAISAGNSHACGIKTDDTAWCWGAGGFGQLGDGTTTATQNVPVAVSGGVTWKAIAGGRDATCGIRSDYTAWCWGHGGFGQLGNGGSISQSSPVAVVGNSQWQEISPGNYATCGISQDGSAFCWGMDTDQQLGNGAFWTPTETFCSSPERPASTLVYNSSSNFMQYCDGVSWVQVGK